MANAQCVPIWDGPGTVKVIVAGPDKEPVDDTIVDDVEAHIEAERPIGAAVTVVTVAEKDINVAATVTLATGATTQQVQDQMEAALGELLGDLPFGQENVIRWSRVLALLLNCDGVEDYSAFTVNGGTANITAGAEETPVVGTVTITEGS